MTGRIEAKSWVRAPHRFTVEDYHRMGEAGILHEDSRVELIAGEIVAMPPIGGGHMWGVNRVSALCSRRLADRAIVSVQNPIRLDEGNEPQPDIVLLRPSAAATREVPRPEDVLLLIEVADTTLQYDRDVKIPLYAAAGIPEAWLLDLRGDHLRVYREPDAGEYCRVEVLGRGDTITPLAFADVRFPVDDILG